MTQAHKLSIQEENNYLPIEDFLLWSEQRVYKIPKEVQDRLLNFSWLKDTRALKCLFGSQLVKFLNLTEEQIELLGEIYLQFSPVVIKSLEDPDNEYSKFFSTGFKSIDQLLQGGIETGHLFEFAGPAASGKTQLCYTSVLSCFSQINDSLPGNSVLWIDTEHSLLPKKMSNVVKNQKQNTKHLFKYTKVHTFLELLQAFLKLLEFCQSESNLRLIIIDSLIAPFNRQYKKDYAARAQALRKILGFLKNVSREFNCAVIITNQVRGALTDTEKETTQKFFPLGGFALAHATENRFLIEPLDGRRRKIKVLDSSYLPAGETIFYLGKEGIANGDTTTSSNKKEDSSSPKEKKVFD